MNQPEKFLGVPRNLSAAHFASLLFETLNEGTVKQELHVEEFLCKIILSKGQISLLD